MSAGRKYVVGRAADLADGERLIVTVGGRSIGIFNVGGKFYGLPNSCPHKGAEMCRGVLVGELSSPRPGEFSYDADRRYVTCPWHGWEFDIATGQSYFDPTGTRTRTYAVEVEPSPGSFTPGEYARLVQDGFRLREPGPYSVETFAVTVEDDYLVVDLAPVRPKRERPAR
ncbi:Rieske (2Fe-2S) protein [Dactylosporangium sp. CS-033363]|uniref:Rieske (2Fe-2S) protein n=1 Tax=Dactylosporangium sp. CS-033363 TaxID=3239935 RepID=UPI003D8E3D4F